MQAQVFFQMDPIANRLLVIDEENAVFPSQVALEEPQEGFCMLWWAMNHTWVKLGAENLVGRRRKNKWQKWVLDLLARGDVPQEFIRHLALA